MLEYIKKIMFFFFLLMYKHSSSVLIIYKTPDYFFQFLQFLNILNWEDIVEPRTDEIFLFLRVMIWIYGCYIIISIIWIHIPMDIFSAMHWINMQPLGADLKSSK